MSWLLDHSADINRRARFGGTIGMTPLLVAAAWAGQKQMVRVLIDRGADLLLREPRHDGTAGEWASHFGNDEIQRMLENAGAAR